MPDRIIRERWRTDHDMNRLSDRAERLFWRLQTVADDYGCFDADPRVLLCTCFPLKVGEWMPDDMVAPLAELASGGPNDEPSIVLVYSAAGRAYGQLRAWAEDQRARDSKPKFPLPPGFCRVLPLKAASRGKLRPIAGESRDPRGERRETQ